MSTNRDAVISDYVRMKIREWKESKKELKALAAAAGTAKSGPSTVLGGTGVGGGKIAGYARAFGFSSKEALMDAAYDWWRSQGKAAAAAVDPARAHEYPARAAAIPIVLALSGGATEAQIRTILAAYTHERFADRDTEFWMTTLLAELKHDAELARPERVKNRAISDEQAKVRAVHRQRAEAKVDKKRDAAPKSSRGHRKSNAG